MPKAIIFDIDGTLIDSVDGHAAAWVDTFRHLGMEVAFDAVRAQIGKGGDLLMPVFLEPDRIEREGREIERFRGDLFKRSYLPQVRAFPAVRALFERIRGDGKLIVLASSAKADELERYAGIAGIADLVDASTSSSDAAHSKPYPDIVQAAVEKAGVAPSEAIMVGDTPYDAEAAWGAGVQTVGVLCGGFPEASLKGAGCVAIYRDPADLLARYEASPLAG